MLTRFTQKNLTQNLSSVISMGLVLSGLLVITGCDNANSSNAKTTVKATSSTTSATSAPSASAAVATPHDNDTKVQQLLQANLAKAGIDTKVLSATPTSMPNIYWVKAQGMPALFTDSTGQYVIQGEIVKLAGDRPQSISADLQARDAKAALATVDTKDMIIFPAKGTTKAVINVFTDADCGYCRKLHSEINEINALGIEVRYLPWPRSEQTFPIMEKIWCSKDRNLALTQAKAGEPIEASQCENPVKRIHDLGLSIGVSGTPAIYSKDGKHLGGYLPPQQLAQALEIQ